jgi:hypothetical protein
MGFDLTHPAGIKRVSVTPADDPSCSQPIKGVLVTPADYPSCSLLRVSQLLPPITRHIAYKGCLSYYRRLPVI